MTLTARELAVLRTPLGPRYDDRLERFVAKLRGFGIQGRGPVSGGRGIEGGSVIPDSEVVDDFESASTTNYRLINGSDNTRFDTPAYEGSYGWRTDGPHPVATNTEWASQPGDGLPVYPAPGDRLLVWGHAITSGGSAAILFPAHGHSDTYRAYFNPGTVGATDVSAGVSNSASASTSQDTWYELVIDWYIDGTLDVTVRDGAGNVQGSVSLHQTTYSASSDKGIGFRFGPDGEQNAFDFVRVRKGYND